jgi:tripartite-type tricarboxylate transporter receptor subunit TctC
VSERQTSQGVEPICSTSEYFSEFIKTELVKWGKVVKDAGIKLD